MEYNITSLEEISENQWQAKYSGNYGIYTVKIRMNADGERVEFSCSCPSDYYPCKHIPVIEEAVRMEMGKNRNSGKRDFLEKILELLSPRELRDFVTEQFRYNQQLADSFLLNYSDRIKKAGENKYSEIIREGLNKINLDYESFYDYYDDSIEIEILNVWLEKAKEYLAAEKFHEASAIAKACIEEYAAWMECTDRDILEYIEVSYEEIPVEILYEAAGSPEINSAALYQYCKNEISKPKYEDTNFFNDFNDLMRVLAGEENAADFLGLQDQLLSEIADKSSYEAEIVFRRKIEFYTENNQPAEAWKIISENIQIESFRKKVIIRRMSEKKWDDAKLLINEYLQQYGENAWHHGDWKQLLLDIALAERDIPAVREISFGFIKERFDAKFFQIYKATYEPEKWDQVMEELLKNYEKENAFSKNVADLLAEEKATRRLTAYIEKHLSINILDDYYSHFYDSFPGKTLSMFRRVIDQYAAANTGRRHYEYIAELMEQMKRIINGEAVVRDMIDQYKIRYKNRRAMMEILNGI